MLQITTNSLKAAITMAAVKDVRYFLNGVFVGVTEDGAVHVKATDGIVAFEDVMPTKCETQKGPFSIIIPLDSAKLVAKSKSPTVTLSALHDGKYALGDVIFTPIDGVFPDTDRVFAARDSKYDATMAHYDFELLARCQIAMRLATGCKNKFYRVQNSPTGLVCREIETFPRCAIQGLDLNRCFVDN
jgi:DNA polymerase III sliding clamp (beta) subunit (PCNA family)